MAMGKVTIDVRTAEMRDIIGSILILMRKVDEENLTPLVAIQSGYVDTMLKVVDRLAKIADVEFGTKSKVMSVADPRAEFAALAPAEKRERLAEARHRLLELEQETSEERH